jgi:hypothetical protein
MMNRKLGEHVVLGECGHPQCDSCLDQTHSRKHITKLTHQQLSNLASQVRDSDFLAIANGICVFFPRKYHLLGLLCSGVLVAHRTSEPAQLVSDFLSRIEEK